MITILDKSDEEIDTWIKNYEDRKKTERLIL